MLLEKNLAVLRSAGDIKINPKFNVEQLQIIFNLTNIEATVFEELMQRDLVTFSEFLHGWVGNFRFDGVVSSKVDSNEYLSEDKRGVRDIKCVADKVVIVVPSRGGSRMITVDEDEVSVAVFDNSDVTIETTALLATELTASFFDIDFIKPSVFEHSLHSFCYDDDLTSFYTSSLSDANVYLSVNRSATKWKISRMSQQIMPGSYLTYFDKVKRAWACKLMQTFNYDLPNNGKRVTKTVDGNIVLDSFYSNGLLTERLGERLHTFFCRDVVGDVNLITGGAKTTSNPHGTSSPTSTYDIEYGLCNETGRIVSIDFDYALAVACKSFVLK